MKAVVFPGGSKVEFMEFPDPTPGPGRGQRGHACCVLRRPRVTAASRCIRPKL